MKKVYAYFLILIMVALLISGCDGFIPNPNEEYDEENTVLDHIKVFPAKVEMTINESKIFEVKAYNSDNNLIRIDASEVKWVVMYSCANCGVVWNISPTTGTLQTNFVPKKTGKFKVHANYQGKWAHAEVNVK